MTSFLLSIALMAPTIGQPATPQPRGNIDEKMPVQKIDGDWMVVYAEKDGKKLEGKGFTEVTIKNNVVTCRHEGKEESWKMDFGPHNMIRCTEMINGKVNPELTQDKRDTNEKGYHTHYGVYIASPDYFCLSLNKGRDRRSFSSTETSTGERGAAIQAGNMQRFGQEPHASHFVVVLRRTGTQTSSSR